MGVLNGSGVEGACAESPSAALQCGVEAWNAFRRGHPGYIVANRASLSSAQLPQVDMHCVLLMDSDLHCANLRGAILRRAILRNSDLRESDLHEANLEGADLCRADFSGADLRGANLHAAFLKRTDLTGADLSTARGLTTAQISEAYGDARTKLPEGIVRPTGWTLQKSSQGAA